MNTMLERLRPGQRAGSKPRCLFLTSGSRADVAGRLTALIAPHGVVTTDDEWMPKGFDDVKEAQLHDAPRLLPVDPLGRALETWWLADVRSASVTPSWDIAGTCTIDGKWGLFLVEAKAHHGELKADDRCRARDEEHFRRIGAAVHEADRALNAIRNGWRLSHECRYQLSNRFAWSWKLADLGIPVVLVYLGFLAANEMTSPFDDDRSWDTALREYAAGGVPDDVWNGKLLVGDTPLYPLIRTWRIPGASLFAE